MSSTLRRLLRPAFLVTALAMLSACNAVTRLSEIGTSPPLTPIENPKEQPDYRLVSLPMPNPQEPTHMANSLWRHQLDGHVAIFLDTTNRHHLALIELQHGDRNVVAIV